MLQAQHWPLPPLRGDAKVDTVARCDPFGGLDPPCFFFWGSFSPYYLGKWSNLANIFELGWNNAKQFWIGFTRTLSYDNLLIDVWANSAHTVHLYTLYKYNVDYNNHCIIIIVLIDVYQLFFLGHSLPAFLTLNPHIYSKTLSVDFLEGCVRRRESCFSKKLG